MKSMLTGVAVVALLAFGIPSAYADVAITCDAVTVPDAGGLIGCTHGSAESGLNNILFSDTTAIDGNPLPLPTLVGITDNAHGTPKTAFSFSSTTDLLQVDSGTGGAATIRSRTDGIINNLSYFVTPNQTPFYGSTFNAFTVFDTNLDTTSPDGTAQFVISAVDALGNSETFTSVNFTLGTGQNKFEFVASGGEIMTNIVLAATGVNGVEVLDVKQNQVTLGNTPTSIQEPGSLAGLGTGLLAMSGIIWYRRRKDGV